MQIDPWHIIEDELSTDTNYLHETIFAIGNGYIGMRGNFEEGYQGPANTTLLGTYLNGFYETAPIHYDELAYGYAKNKQTILNVTNSKIIKLYIDEEEFNPLEGKILKYQRRLELKTGLMSREIIWESPQKRQLQLIIKRLIPLEHKHLALINYSVTPLNFSGQIKLISAIDGNVGNQKSVDDSRVGSALSGKILALINKEHDEKYCALTQQAPNSKFKLVCAMHNELKYPTGFEKTTTTLEQSLAEIFTIQAYQEHEINLTKYISYYSSKDFPAEELLPRSKKELEAATMIGFNNLLAEQTKYLAGYYNSCDIEISDDPALQQGLRFNQLQLLMSVGKDGKTSIAAKGVTGEGYEGHYFWDSDTYVLPYFLYNKPAIARNLLAYRYSTLDKARLRAKELSHKGALYAWRTIDGEECSSYYPAGTAAYHINADIIFAVKLYMEATQDDEFLLQHGAEMAFETARFWADIGCYIAKKGDKFCINCVTGPDEYTAIVDNNFYTNIMAQMNLQYAHDIAKSMQQDHPNEFAALQAKLQLTETEIIEWQNAATNMYLPYDKELKINPQDDSFLTKERWDFENTPKSHYPLYHHYHYLNIYRFQVLKQADVILANFWFGDRFTIEEKKRNYDYYEPLTTHDSSLSLCIHSIIAAEIGYERQAYDYFIETARLDLEDLHNGSKHGIHTANMAGTWMGIAFGFAGMRTYNGNLSFKPQLPAAWNSYKLKITFQGRLLALDIGKEGVTYQLLRGEPITFQHQDKMVTLEVGGPLQL